MRDILFRGKDVDTGEWVYGYYFGPVGVCECYEICNINDVIGSMVDVEPETMGQYTGLTDKNGTKIFEGDVFKMEDEIVAVVIFCDGCFRFESHGLLDSWTESGYCEGGGGWGIIECESVDYYYVKDMEVIGNIHDNPELIGGRK